MLTRRVPAKCGSDEGLHRCDHARALAPSLALPAGNKADLAEQRAVATEEAQAYANENGLFYVETSAKTAANVTELFGEIARKLPKAEAAPRQPAGGIVLDAAQPAGATAARKSSCC
jgi:50S ribosomal subunit-associated GTPase HflX